MPVQLCEFACGQKTADQTHAVIARHDILTRTACLQRSPARFVLRQHLRQRPALVIEVAVSRQKTCAGQRLQKTRIMDDALLCQRQNPLPQQQAAALPRPRQNGRHQSPARRGKQGSREEDRGRQHDHRPGRHIGRRRRQRRANISGQRAEQGRKGKNDGCPFAPEPGGRGGNDQQCDDEHQPDQLQAGDGDGQHQPQHHAVGKAGADADGFRMPRIKADMQHGPPENQHHQHADSTAAGNQHRIAEQHARRGAKQKAFQPRLPSGAHHLNDRQQHDAEAEEHRQHGADRRILRQTGVAGEQGHGQQPQPGRQGRAQQQPRQGTAIAAQRHHHHESQRNARQRRMGAGIADQRALAQEQERPRTPRCRPQQARTNTNQSGVIARLHHQRREEGRQDLSHGRAPMARLYRPPGHIAVPPARRHCED